MSSVVNSNCRWTFLGERRGGSRGQGGRLAYRARVCDLRLSRRSPPTSVVVREMTTFCVSKRQSCQRSLRGRTPPCRTSMGLALWSIQRISPGIIREIGHIPPRSQRPRKESPLRGLLMIIQTQATRGLTGHCRGNLNAGGTSRTWSSSGHASRCRSVPWSVARKPPS